MKPVPVRPRINQLVIVVITQQQRADTVALVGEFSEAADHELLIVNALHLSQSPPRPEWYGLAARLETMPSACSSQALRKITSPSDSRCSL